jgi:hypothetical protein
MLNNRVDPIFDLLHHYYNISSDLMAKRKEDNFFSPENAKRPRQELLEDFDKDGDEDECAVSFTNGTCTLVSAKLQIMFN